jgi:hypothetical protein
MKKLILLFIWIFAAGASSAQTSIGLNFGINHSSVNSNYTTTYVSGQSRARLLPRIGLIVEHNLKAPFGLQSGILYSSKGFKLDFEQLRDGIGEGKSAFRFNYLEIPFLVNFKVNNFQLVTGIYFAHALNGKSRTEFNYVDEDDHKKLVSEQSLVFNRSGFLPDENLIPIGFRRNDFGLTAGLAYQIPTIGTLNFLFSQGMINIIPDERNNSSSLIQNASFNLSLSINLKSIAKD